jgi:hypothetical protein
LTYTGISGQYVLKLISFLRNIHRTNGGRAGRTIVLMREIGR